MPRKRRGTALDGVRQLELRLDHRTRRRAYTDALKAWYEGNPGASKSPSLGIFFCNRERNLHQALFGLTTAQLKKRLGIWTPKAPGSRALVKISARDYLPCEWLQALQEAEALATLLVEGERLSPKVAIVQAAAQVRARVRLPEL